jgi:hypothetical protein
MVIFFAIISCTLLIDVIHFPRNPIQRYGFQKFHNVLASIVVGDTIFVLGHENNRHVRKKWSNGLAESGGTDSVLGNGLLYR